MNIIKTMLFLLLFSPLIPSYSGAEIAPPESGKRLIIHKVARGEELHLLAGYYLLNAREWGKLYIWNSGSINNENRIYPGQELIVYVDENWEPPYDLDQYLRKIGRK